MIMRSRKFKTKDWKSVFLRSSAIIFPLAIMLVINMRFAHADERRQVGVGQPSSTVVKSIDELLKVVRQRYRGRILEIELESEGEKSKMSLVYEVKILTRRGRVLELEYHPQTLQLLSEKGKKGKGRRMNRRKRHRGGYWQGGDD